MESNLSLYRIFHTVAKQGNISRAAKELYISQPAISKAISKLEQNLNVTLFFRNSRGVTLTEEGKLLFDSTTTAFHALEQGEENITKMNELGIGHIRIGVSTTLCKYLLLPYLKEFIQRYPHIKITIDCESTIHTIKALEEGLIDIGLIVKASNMKSLDFYSIREIEDIFVTTKTYLDNLKLRETNDHTDIFSSSNLMLLDEENITRMYINEYFKNNGIETKQILEISNMDLLIEFAKISLGVACVIKDFILEDLAQGNLIEVPLKVKVPKRQVGFAYSTHGYHSESVQKFIQFYQTDLLPVEPNPPAPRSVSSSSSPS